MTTITPPPPPSARPDVSAPSTARGAGVDARARFEDALERQRNRESREDEIGSREQPDELAAAPVATPAREGPPLQGWGGAASSDPIVVDPASLDRLVDALAAAEPGAGREALSLAFTGEDWPIARLLLGREAEGVLRVCVVAATRSDFERMERRMDDLRRRITERGVRDVDVTLALFVGARQGDQSL
jgi:hypothetical protein